MIGKNDLISAIQNLPSIQQGLDAVEKLMLMQAEDYHPDLKSALSVILSSGGKRIRPTIILLIGSMLNARVDLIIPLAASIELLHTATLVHDDLIDGAILRRGIPTLNSKWSPAATVLTGDFVFASAAELATKTKSIEVMEIFSRTLMTIVNGEVNQLFNSRCSIDLDDYYRRIYAKTASLFETSTHTAAILSGVDDQKVELLRKFGYEVGMSFQIVDDILDYAGDQSTIGKPVGGDLKQGLVTLPLLYYIQDNPTDKSVISLKEGRCIQEDAEIARLVLAVNSSQALAKAQSDADRFVERAEKFLNEFPESLERTALTEITRYIVERRK